jgi:hypothetical protein
MDSKEGKNREETAAEEEDVNCESRKAMLGSWLNYREGLVKKVF